ncbi:hypothetical protein F5146DRAFT_1006384 [Armillaria mellea]|nr:hypothetical protein F5146DRAFT_1006384 [Armillaria mellea]
MTFHSKYPSSQRPSSAASKAGSAKRAAHTPPPLVDKPKHVKPNIQQSPFKSDSGIAPTVDDNETWLNNGNKAASDTTLSEGHASDSVKHNIETSDSNHATLKSVVHMSEDDGKDTQLMPEQSQEKQVNPMHVQQHLPMPVINLNINSFFNSFMKSAPLMMLPRVKELGISYGDPMPYPLTPFILADYVGGNEIKAEHILKYALAAEGTNLYNLFTVHPRNFCYLIVNKSNDGRKIVHGANNKDASFYMILHFQQLIFSMYKDGLTISSYRKPLEGQKEPKIKPVPMNGETHRPHAYLSTCLPSTDIKCGDYAFMVFTIGGYRSCDDIECVSLNVQFAIELETHVDKDAQTPFDSFLEDFGDETPLGVDDTRVMEDHSPETTDVPISVLPSGPVM